MEPNIFQPQPSSPTPATPRNTPLLLAIVLSLLVGGASGGVVAYSIATGRTGTAASSTAKGATTTLAVKEDSATVDVVKQASPAVVSIIISKDYSKIYGSQPTSPFDNFFGFPFGQTQIPQGQQEIGGGSGFVVGADGTIVTNKHVVSDDQADYTVVMNDGQKFPAKVLAKDPSNDVAVIKIEATGLSTLSLANSDQVEIGQTVIAIGNALGEYRNTVTKGIISGKARTITAGDTSGQTETLEDVFQTDAAINPGNSGGPLLDLSGHVVAINTAVNQQGQLIGFAIPANVVQRDLTSVTKTGTITRPYLGVRYTLITKALADQKKLPVDHGALIQAGSSGEPAVVADSPAEKSGLVESDIITKVDGKDITEEHSLIGLISQYNPGDVVTLEIYHQSTKKEVKATLEEKK